MHVAFCSVGLRDATMLFGFMRGASPQRAKSYATRLMQISSWDEAKAISETVHLLISASWPDLFRPPTS
jgi:hypothetical protein